MSPPSVRHVTRIPAPAAVPLQMECTPATGEDFIDLTPEKDKPKDCCLYCAENFSQRDIVQHLMTSHREENRVLNALRTPIGSKSRQDSLDAIINDGNIKKHKVSVAPFLGSNICVGRICSHNGKNESFIGTIKNFNQPKM